MNKWMNNSLHTHNTFRPEGLRTKQRDGQNPCGWKSFSAAFLDQPWRRRITGLLVFNFLIPGLAPSQALLAVKGIKFFAWRRSFTLCPPAELCLPSVLPWGCISPGIPWSDEGRLGLSWALQSSLASQGWTPGNELLRKTGSKGAPLGRKGEISRFCMSLNNLDSSHQVVLSTYWGEVCLLSLLACLWRSWLQTR